MTYAITTDARAWKGAPEDALRRIAEAGFTHIQWCHHWCDDFLYSPSEIEQIGKWLDEFGLRLIDVHGTAGCEKCWYSTREYQRLAGVELVQNRIHMAVTLGGDAVVMHIPTGNGGQNLTPGVSEAIHRSLDELHRFAIERGVRIAIENMAHDNFEYLAKLLSEYPPDFLGLCYDTGHANIEADNGPARLNALKDRLVCLHLHDNDGTGDQHRIPFQGTVNWEALMPIIKASTYDKPLNLEILIGDEEDESAFYRDALAALDQLARLA